MPNLSIIIPHYNIPQLLKKLLDTIPKSDDIQVVVVDDNSDVDTEYYNGLQFDYSHVTFLRNHTGKNSAGTCRNIGLQHATGRWVLFADADDYFMDGFYETVGEYFDSSYDIVFFAPTSIEISSGKVSNRHILYEMRIKKCVRKCTHSNMLKLKYLWGAPWSKLIRWECIANNHILFDETPVSNDAMFSVKLAHNVKNVIAVDRTIYVITMREASLTTLIDENMILVRLGVLVRRYDFLRENLSKSDFRCVDIALGDSLFEAYKNKYPLKLIFKIVALLRKNKVRIFKREYFKPSFFPYRLKRLGRKFTKNYHRFRKES